MYYWFESARINERYENLLGYPVIADSKDEAYTDYVERVANDFCYTVDEFLQDYETRLVWFGTYTVIKTDGIHEEILFETDDRMSAWDFYNRLPVDADSDEWYSVLSPVGEDETLC